MKFESLNLNLSVDTTIQRKGLPDTKITLRNILPVGWSDILVDDIIDAISKFDIETISIKIKNGVLYISEPSENILFKRIMRTISQDSSKLCMVCSKKGIRRKNLENKPPLCTIHYLHYLNSQDSNNV